MFYGQILDVFQINDVLIKGWEFLGARGFGLESKFNSKSFHNNLIRFSSKELDCFNDGDSWKAEGKNLLY